MKNLSYFLLGVMFVTLISATTVSIMTVQPAKPKAVVVFKSAYLETSVTRINQYIKQGYIVKIIAGPNKYGSTIVVMEKY